LAYLDHFNFEQHNESQLSCVEGISGIGIILLIASRQRKSPACTLF